MFTTVNQVVGDRSRSWQLTELTRPTTAAASASAIKLIGLPARSGRPASLERSRRAWPGWSLSGADRLTRCRPHDGLVQHLRRWCLFPASPSSSWKRALAHEGAAASGRPPPRREGWRPAGRLAPGALGQRADRAGSDRARLEHVGQRRCGTGHERRGAGGVAVVGTVDGRRRAADHRDEALASGSATPLSRSRWFPALDRLGSCASRSPSSSSPAMISRRSSSAICCGFSGGPYFQAHRSEDLLAICLHRGASLVTVSARPGLDVGQAAQRAVEWCRWTGRNSACAGQEIGHRTPPGRAPRAGARASHGSTGMIGQVVPVAIHGLDPYRAGRPRCVAGRVG
jgi:hypothetical protein